MTRRLKSRLLNRDIHHEYRDDSLYHVACDDTHAPGQYFDFFRLKRIKIHVIPTQDGTSSASYVLDRLLEIECEEQDERWLLLDVDHCLSGAHRSSFLRALDRAAEEKVQIALSKPCFEFWLLLHHLDSTEPRLMQLANANAVEELLRETLGSYNKCNLRAEHFPLNRVPCAIQNAQSIDPQVVGGNAPVKNTSRVYQIWESIIRKMTYAQLPEELHEIKSNLKH